MIIWLRWQSLVAICFCSILAGCAATASRLAVPYVVELQAMFDVNPNVNGAAAPVQVTVYELKSVGKFQSTGYFGLQGDAAQALGDELLATSRVILKPGTREVIIRPGDVNAKALGIVAGYRELDVSQWRMVVDLPESRSTNIYKFWQFSPGEQRISIEVGKHGMTLVAND